MIRAVVAGWIVGVVTGAIGAVAMLHAYGIV